MKTAIAPQMTYPRANTLTTVGETLRLNRYRIINAANAMPIYEPQTIGSTLRRCLMSSICCGVPCFMSLDYKAASANAKIKLRMSKDLAPLSAVSCAAKSCSPARHSLSPPAFGFAMPPAHSAGPKNPSHQTAGPRDRGPKGKREHSFDLNARLQSLSGFRRRAFLLNCVKTQEYFLPTRQTPGTNHQTQLSGAAR